MNRKIIACLLASALLILAACSPPPPDPPETSAAVPSPEETEAPAGRDGEGEETAPQPVPSPEETGEAPESSDDAAALSRQELERFASRVREAYLDEDWETLAGLIRYPVTVAGTELKDADAFLDFLADAEISPEDREAMEREDCRDLTVGAKGVMLGGGQVWLTETEDLGLRIAALGGILVPQEPDAETRGPKVTKDPATEWVEPGGSCWFVAGADGALRAEWRFRSPNGREDYRYDEVLALFPGLEIVDPTSGTMQMKNIPAQMHGWKVYCRFSDGVDIAETAWAEIRVGPPPREP